MSRDLDATDLAIHSLIGAWAIKHRVLMTAAAMEELEGELLRPVFVERDALRGACKSTLDYWGDTGFADCEQGCTCIVDQVRAALAPARVGE